MEQSARILVIDDELGMREGCRRALAPLGHQVDVASDVSGRIIRLAIPPLSEERRQELAKMVKKMTEEQKVIIRNIRRDAHEDLKKMEKDKEISQDDLKRGETRLQKLTDTYVALADQVALAKETELKQV